MSTIRKLRRKMTSAPKPDLPVPPPYKFNQLPEDYRRILNCIFNKYIEGSHFYTDVGLTRHEARKTLVELFDNGELRLVVDNVRANGQTHPEDRYGLELWNCTADTFTLI